MSYGAQCSRWQSGYLAEPGTSVLVAEVSAEPVGVAAAGRSRLLLAPFEAELYAAYVRPSHWRQGIGRKLVGASAARLYEAGFTSMLVSVFAANPPCRFCEALGGIAVEARTVEIGGATVPTRVYGWRDMTGLV